MFEKTKLRRSFNKEVKILQQKLEAEADKRPTAESSSQYVFEYIMSKAYEDLQDFVSSNEPQATILHMNNIDPIYDHYGNFRNLSQFQADSLLEVLYLGFGVENPQGDSSRWIYDSNEHVATTQTDFGFDIVETRYIYERATEQNIPLPQECGMFSIKVVRQIA